MRILQEISVKMKVGLKNMMKPAIYAVRPDVVYALFTRCKKQASLT